MTNLSIIERCEALGIDFERLDKALDSHDNWGHMVHSFEYLTVLGIVRDAMRAEQNVRDVIRVAFEDRTDHG